MNITINSSVYTSVKNTRRKMIYDSIDDLKRLLQNIKRIVDICFL